MQDAPSPFHAGERAIQARAGVFEQMQARGGRYIRDAMPDQHRTFFAALSFLPVALSAEDDRPLATILTAPLGFISSPDAQRLRIAALPDPDILEQVRFEPGAAVGVLGIDFATRRRNRANGRIDAVTRSGFEIAVTQSFGNCAQYIQARDIERVGPATNAALTRSEQLSAIDGAARALVEDADTFFVASGSEAGMDMSHRGGAPGFVRVDGDVLTVPDFSGNRYFNTLGNFVLNPRAALLFPDFRTGDLLHLSGDVEIVWDTEEVSRYRGAQRLWRARIVAGWRRRAALAFRWLVLQKRIRIK